MPEPSPSAAEALVADERELGITADTGLAPIGAVESGPEGAKRGKHLGFAAWLAIAWMVFVVGTAILAPILPIEDPNAIVDNGRLQLAEPSAEHPFGGDANSRDVLARTIWGSRASLVIGVGAIVFGLAVGGTVGVIGAYYKGKIGAVINATLDIFLAFPQLLLALYVVSILGRENWKIALALGIVATPILARIARASTLTWSEREFVLAARAQGAKNRRIMLREVLPNVLPAIFSIALLAIAVAIIAEASLAQLGVGVTLPTPSWGNIIFEGRSDLSDAPWLILAPSAFIFLTVLSLNYLGDVIRARFDVRESSL